MKKYSNCLLMGLTLGSSLALNAAEPAAKPSFCFVTEWCNGEQEDVPLVAELRRAGFLIDNMGIQNLTPDKMKQYNALIFPEFPLTDPLLKPGQQMAWQVHPDLFKQFNPVIDEYVKNGGGVVVYGVCFFQGQLLGMAPMNKMMEPWGATTLYEQVWDSERQYHYKQLFAHEYSWTANLTKHPLTEGLKRIYYLSDGYHGPTTCTFKLSKAWTPLVCGEATARSVPGNTIVGGVPDFFVDKKGSHDSAPPLIAVRDHGKGRIAVIGITPQVAVFGARFAGYGNVVMDVGDGNIGSDYGKLQERIYRWAAEPAAKAGTPGGYVEKPATHAVNPDLQTPPIDWPQFDPGAAGPAPFHGLIGARTQAGGGSGSVAEYVAAAEKAGLQFIAFTEDFTRLNAEKWEAFKKTCREASTQSVVAIPGFLYRDQLNARWVAAGDFAFPLKARLSVDGKRIIGPMWWFDSNCPLNAPIDVGHNPRPYWTYGIYGTMAVKTFENGKLLDDATDAYLDRQEIEDVLAPITVDLINAPSKVAASSAHRTGVLVPNQDELRLAFTRNDNNGNLFSASTGPAITDWRGFNLTRTTQGRWEPVPGTERLAVCFKTVSEAGLKSVRLLDGPHLLRRFDAAGAKEFGRTVHLLHDRQRHLMVSVEDANGNTAVSGPLFWQCDQLNVHRMCGDRGNTIDFSVLRTDSGRVFINGPVAPYQRKTTMFGFFPGYCDLTSKYAAPYVDGGLRPVVHQSNPRVIFKGEKFPEGTFASRMAHPLSSRDVIIQQSDLIGWYTNQFAGVWESTEPVQEPKDVTVSVRWLDFAKRYRDPGFTLVEGTLTFLRDGDLDPGQEVNPLLHQMMNASTDLNTPAFSIEGAGTGGRLAGLTSKDSSPLITGPIAQGGYVALLPCLWGAGAVLMLDPGHTVSAAMARPQIYAQFGLAMGGQKVRKGQEIRYRFLAGRGILGAESSDREWREFVAKMGFNGKPAYAPAATQGQILSAVYLLEGETKDNGFAATIAKAALPVRLPICVHPVNPKWSAAIANVADGSFLPMGVIETEQKAYATWDAGKESEEIYAGNIVMCDSKDLILTAVCAGSQWEVDAHNPTEKPVTATLRGAAKFKPLSALKQQVEVPPGQSVVIQHPSK
ncbi:MAG: hypothetical protein HY360_12945 [Verrucomicrobia bacterium]|nr:hypothetical protein [Verrucomicrobiota bacterium]